MRKQVGYKFGRLTVLSLSMEVRGCRRRRVALCQCECGTIKNIGAAELGRHTHSCGCIYREKAAKMNRSHGRSGTPEYRAWKAMLQRCRDTKTASYKNYGGRGINVCPEWQQNFEAFFDHIGLKPSPEFTIERINNDHGYEPGNVRWATRLEQGSNTRKNRFIEINGETKTLSQWARVFGIPVPSLWRRLEHGGVSSLLR